MDEKHLDKSYIMIANVRQELPPSKLERIQYKLYQNKYKQGDDESICTINVGEGYIASVVMYPAGYDDCYNECCLGIKLEAIADPTGASHWSWRHAKVSVFCTEQKRRTKKDDKPVLMELTSFDDVLENVIDEEIHYAIRHPDDDRDDFLQRIDRLFVMVAISAPNTRIQRKSAEMFRKQQISVYENSKKYGDITLRIICDEKDIPTEPPRKRRRLEKEQDGEKENGAVSMQVSGIILRSASTVFESMLENEMKEKKEKIIEIHADNVGDVDDLIYYVCCRSLRQGARVLSLIKLAHLYQLNALFDACVMRILKELNGDNFVESANLFNRYEIKDGYDEIVEFGRQPWGRIKNYKNLCYAFRCAIEQAKKHDGERSEING